MKVEKYSYVGKEVFVGIDVHKKKYVIAVACDGVLVKKWSSIAGPQTLVDQLTRMFKGAKIFSAYEAGFSGFMLHRTLIKAGINNLVVNPASIELASNDRVKTDRRDAIKLAEQLAMKRLKGIYIPSETEEAKRALSRGRQQAVRRKQRICNQIKGKLHYLGLPPDDRDLTEARIQKIENLDLEQGQIFHLKELCLAWREEVSRIKRYEAELKLQANEDPLEKVYRSAPGIGKVTSRILSNELGDMSRFSNERQLFSYTGLTPSEFSSGDQVRKGHISRQGSAIIRSIIIEVAWTSIKKDSTLLEFYQRVSGFRGGKRAIVAVARKLLGRIRSCFVGKTMWQFA